MTIKLTSGQDGAAPASLAPPGSTLIDRPWGFSGYRPGWDFLSSWTPYALTYGVDASETGWRFTVTTTELPTPAATCGDPETELEGLVAAARAGCATSWRAIVDRFDDCLWRVARARGLDGPTADDVVQQTWLAAVTNIETLRSAPALGSWLRSILHRECLKALSLRQRETPRIEDIELIGNTNGRTIVMRTEPRSPEEETLQREQRRLVRTAQRRLSRRDQDLLTLLVVEPPLPYTEISRRLGMPVGSIGPTRARCFARLRRELAALDANGGYGAKAVRAHSAAALGSTHAGWARSRA